MSKLKMIVALVLFVCLAHFVSHIEARQKEDTIGEMLQWIEFHTHTLETFANGYKSNELKAREADYWTLWLIDISKVHKLARFFSNLNTRRLQKMQQEAPRVFLFVKASLETISNHEDDLAKFRGNKRMIARVLEDTKYDLIESYKTKRLELLGDKDFEYIADTDLGRLIKRIACPKIGHEFSFQELKDQLGELLSAGRSDSSWRSSGARLDLDQEYRRIDESVKILSNLPVRAFLDIDLSVQEGHPMTDAMRESYRKDFNQFLSREGYAMKC